MQEQILGWPCRLVLSISQSETKGPLSYPQSQQQIEAKQLEQDLGHPSTIKHEFYEMRACLVLADVQRAVAKCQKLGIICTA